MAHLTKDQLKDILISEGVDKVPSSMKKDEMVALLKETVRQTSGSGPGLMYSSDEEDGEEVVVSKKGVSNSSRKSSSKKASRQGGSELTKDDVSKLTNHELFAKLQEFNIDVGPVQASTRSIYEKKLLKLISGEDAPTQNVVQNGGQNGSHNGDHSKGLGQFSADDDTEDDEQPSPVVSKLTPQKTSRSSKKSPIKAFAETASTFRQRITGSPKDKDGGRFTPTPRRSIHTYKVTEVTNHKRIKTPDGQISHDYSHSRSEEEDKGSRFENVQGFLLRNLPRLFMVIIFISVVYFTMKANKIDVDETWNKIQTYFQTPSNVQEEDNADQGNFEEPRMPRDPLDEQPSIANV